MEKYVNKILEGRLNLPVTFMPFDKIRKVVFTINQPETKIRNKLLKRKITIY